MGLERHTGPNGGSEALADLARGMVGEFRTAEDTATAFLRHAIVCGFLGPGERINQDEIADVLGVSRIPIRAALRHLEAERLVEVHAYRGVSVRQLTPQEVAEIFELRLLLESEALERAHANMSAEDLAHVRAAARELDHRSGDPMPWVNARRSFYCLLYSYADRPLLLELVDQLRTELGPHLAVHGATEQHGAHEDLLDLLEAGDLAGATGWLRDHLGEICRRVLAAAGETRALRPGGARTDL